MPIDRSDYERIADVPDDVLATRFVGQLILAKGNLARYAALTEMLIRELRVSHSHAAVDERMLRKIVDVTFGYANEDQSVPSHEVATRLIDRTRSALTAGDHSDG